MRQKNNNAILLAEIRALIQNARQVVYRNINTLQVVTNFLIGKTIVEDKQEGKLRAGYAKEQLTIVSRKLTKEFGRGYSVDNLELMRKFYFAYEKRIGISALPISEALPRKSQNKTSRALVVKPVAPISQALPRNSSSDKHLLKLTWTHFVLLMKN